MDNYVKTIGDDDGYERVVTKGVPQGSPLSHSLFNIYFDNLIENLQDSRQLCNKLEVILFADYVACIAERNIHAQKFLEICASLATQKGDGMSSTKVRDTSSPRDQH